MYDTIIIGAGIAGLTAAIYASRKKMNFEIISSDFGGQFLQSGEVLNYPGIIQTTGVDFSETMQKQMDFNKVKVKAENVNSVEKDGENFKVKTESSEYSTKTVIIATGARPRKLGIPGEQEYANKGVTYCSICDGPLFGGKTVAVIGGGDAGFEAADFMKNIAEKIFLLTNEEKFRAHEYLQENIKNSPKIVPIFSANTKQIVGEKFVTGLKYEQKGEEKTIDVGGVIVEIGRIPNTEIFKDFLDIDQHGHIIIDCETKTSIPGIFAAGDCASGHEYQYVIAAGQGCMALIKAARYLAKKL